jgi:hypothetical protein
VVEEEYEFWRLVLKILLDAVYPFREGFREQQDDGRPPQDGTKIAAEGRFEKRRL